MNDPFGAFDSSTFSNTNSVTAFEDPAADFLARDEAELAKIENNNNNQFSDDGFGDFDGTSIKDNIKSESYSNGFDSNLNFFGENNGISSETTTPQTSSDLDSKSNQTSSSIFTTSIENNKSKEPEKKDLYSAIHTMDQMSIEPDKIKKWREDQKIRLENKDAEEEQKKKEWKDSAKKELEEWYKKRSEQLIKTHENHKTAEAEMYSKEAAGGQAWDKLAKLCDFNPKANKNVRDVGRMRSILLQLKQQPLVR